MDWLLDLMRDLDVSPFFAFFDAASSTVAGPLKKAVGASAEITANAGCGIAESTQESLSRVQDWPEVAELLPPFEPTQIHADMGCDLETR
ncbi:hypothetical protein SAMN05428969_2842 [Devosia sp. YR412]|uniref:hypothetical protein n=1 Tax=Devosia sp. YR412 TaxID=1881030 RepID=UPI0008CE13F3|nr:hypothetical protein [Devosia sp. YR412]SEQ38173.1 hypothetical protein SAMN05428969_2842 [Devosia sp. YR412]